MKSFSCCLSLVFLSVWVLGAGENPPAVFSVVAVRINAACVGGADAGEHCNRDIDCSSNDCGGSIAPTNSITVNRGDKIQCEVFASDWSAKGQQLTVVQYTFDTAKFQGEPPASCGALIPLRGPRSCVSDLECTDATAACVDGFCDVFDDRAGGAFMRLGRPDYVFVDLGQFPATDFTNYRFAATLFNPNDGPVYVPPPKYVGTLILTVSDDAGGVFTVDGNTTTQYETHMLDFDRAFILPLVTEPLTINVDDICEPDGCEVIESTYPPNCALDARQPSRPDGTQRRAWNSIEFTFEDTKANPCPDTSFMTTDYFSVRVVPSEPLPIAVSSVTPNGNKITVTLSRGIALQKWTCVTYHGPDPSGDQERCFGHLPADVSNDGTSGPSDILWLIDCLNGVRLCRDYQCDADRSELCAPPDINRVIDLLNGAGQYDPWLNESMPRACPSQ
ncbi:MAG: hypothetical protein JSU86_19630 [Phycisphaerales bacterium]|nr:MAG: hypothetical protein JSU86_19630 [Phycisphaerales bacterium]